MQFPNTLPQITTHHSTSKTTHLNISGNSRLQNPKRTLICALANKLSQFIIGFDGNSPQNKIRLPPK